MSDTETTPYSAYAANGHGLPPGAPVPLDGTVLFTLAGDRELRVEVLDTIVEAQALAKELTAAGKDNVDYLEEMRRRLLGASRTWAACRWARRTRSWTRWRRRTPPQKKSTRASCGGC